MKTIFYATLLLSVFLFTSCKADKDRAMRAYYRQVNKHSVIENRLLSDDNTLAPITSEPKRGSTSNYSSEQAYIDAVKAKSDEYKVLYDDSEIANGNVYREAVAHRNKLAQDCNCGSTENKTVADTSSSTNTSTVNTTTATGNATSSAIVNTAAAQNQSRTPDFFSHLLEADKNLIRKVNVTCVDENDRAQMKQFSVVIAALARTRGVEYLKMAFADSHDRLFFVRNEAGLYYPIIGSYDSEAEATAKLREVQLEYNSLYTKKQLRNKFRLPFTDLWILRK
jgi:hypothetical protein